VKLTHFPQHGNLDFRALELDPKFLAAQRALDEMRHGE
jgi:hypothetical protein